MKLYEECLTAMSDLLASYPCRSLTPDGSAWPDAGKNQIIFRDDTAYELGGGTLPAVSGIAFTDCADCIPCDEILLCGEDLPGLCADMPFARLAFIRVREDAMGEDNAFYQALRKIEYTRYHLNPRGYMIRISAIHHRESVRISQAALHEGLDFARVGRLFLQAYHAHPAVEAVKLIFITHPDFPYGELARIAEHAENTTKALDHLLQKVKMDCNACNLKEICAEVEKLCEEDFPGR